MYNLSSYYVGASGYELQQRGKGKVKRLECPPTAASGPRATRPCCPGLVELAAPHSAACSPLFTASPYSGESNNLNVGTSPYRILSYLLFQLILTVLGERNDYPSSWVSKLNFKYFMIYPNWQVAELGFEPRSAWF